MKYSDSSACAEGAATDFQTQPPVAVSDCCVEDAVSSCH